jgi:protoheme ferro-lyase
LSTIRLTTLIKINHYTFLFLSSIKSVPDQQSRKSTANPGLYGTHGIPDKSHLMNDPYFSVATSAHQLIASQCQPTKKDHNLSYELALNPFEI